MCIYIESWYCVIIDLMYNYLWKKISLKVSPEESKVTKVEDRQVREYVNIDQGL